MNSTNYWKILLVGLSLAGTISLSACNEDPEEFTSDSDVAESIVTDEAIADDLFVDVDLISDEASLYEGSTQGGRLEDDDSALLRDCVGRLLERREENKVFTKIVTLDFQEGCEGPKGRERQGTMVITRITDANEATYTVSTTFQDFFLDGKKVEGTRTRIYTKLETGVHQVAITLTDGKVTLEDGRIIERSGSFIKNQNRNSGEISVEGEASGINRNGVAYTATVTSPLVYKQSCATEGIFMATQGTRSIAREGKADVTIDYGQGDCDKTVAVTVNGEERTLELTITKNN